MIEEQGTIIETRNDIAFISVEKGSECDSCGSKALCKPGEGVDKSMVVEARNPIGAHVGERVLFTVGAATVLRAGMMLYLVPLLSFIAGVVVGQVLGPELMPDSNLDLVSAVLGFVFVALSFAGLRIYGKRAETSETYRPAIVRIIE
ncbi:MAG: SoxR reducing system RseC family protein [Thermodesulfobacteriota bacterium]